MSKSKEILITIDPEGRSDFKTKNMSLIEAMGILRFYEKDIWLILQQNKLKNTNDDADLHTRI